MKINDSTIDNIVDNIMKMDLPGFEVTGTEISAPIMLDEKEGIFEVPVKIKLKKGWKPKKWGNINKNGDKD